MGPGHGALASRAAAATPAPEGAVSVTGRRSRARLAPGVLGLLVFLLLLIGLPVWQLIAMSLNVGDPQAIPTTEWGLDNFVQVMRRLEWIRNSLLVSVAGALLGTAVALVLAWIVYRTTVPARELLETLVVIPYYMTPLVGGLAWSALGAPTSGLLNRLFTELTGLPGPLVNTHSVPGIIACMAIYESPVAFLMIGAAMRGMDPSLEESSAVMGGGKVTTALRITLPLLRPAILGAALYLVVSMMGAFAIPAILGADERFYVVTTAIYALFKGYPPKYPLTAALGLVLVLFTALAVWLYGRSLGSRSFAVIGGRMYRPRLIDMGRWTPVLFGVVCLYLLVSLVLPLGVLVLASFQRTDRVTLDVGSWTLQNYGYVLFEYEPTRQALQNSIVLGVGTGTLGVLVAALVAWSVYRTHATGRRALEYLVMIPIAVPRLVLSLGLLWLFVALPLRLYGTAWVLLLAYVIVFLPLAYRSLSGVIVQLDRSLEEVARVSGASWLYMMRTVTLPLLRPGVTTAWLLLFIVSIREVSASLMLASPQARVLGPAIFNFWESGGLAQVSALTIVQTVIIVALLTVVHRIAEHWERRSLQAS